MAEVMCKTSCFNTLAPSLKVMGQANWFFCLNLDFLMYKMCNMESRLEYVNVLRRIQPFGSYSCPRVALQVFASSNKLEDGFYTESEDVHGFAERSGGEVISFHREK